MDGSDSDKEEITFPHTFKHLSPRTHVTVTTHINLNKDDPIYIKTVYSPAKGLSGRQPAFVLYRGELSLCHIEKDQELPEAVYREIMDEILWKRIRMRCLYLLKSMDRTEYQLRTKLKQNLYPEELIERVIRC